jgi:lysophospholipase L1-like esterase
MAAAPEVDRPGSAAWPLAATSEGPASDDGAHAAMAGSSGLPNGLPSSAVGALDRPAALRHLFEALARIDGGQSHEDVTLVQFGDSHTAADFETGPLRRALQARFGDGGRGFVALGTPYKKYVQEGLRCGLTSEWAQDRGKLARGTFTGDGMYGLCGVSLKTTRPGARAWADYTARASKIELAYLEQPRGGSLDVFIDGSRVGRVSTKARATASGFHAFDVSEGPHRVEVATVGDGEVRLFGAILDRAQVGLTFDALGINGARISNALTWNEQHMAEQLRHRAPDLVILAYGTNEAGDDTSTEAYERQLVDMLGRVARAAPTASCMLLGPPDRAIKTREGTWVTLPKLIDVIATQRRVAQAAGCAYYDQLEAMGGPGAIAAWAEEAVPRAGHDHVHLTRDGYAQLGNAVAADILRAYGAWRAETGLPPIASPPAPRPAPPPADPSQPIAHAN